MVISMHIFSPMDLEHTKLQKKNLIFRLRRAPPHYNKLFFYDKKKITRTSWNTRKINKTNNMLYSMLVNIDQQKKVINNFCYVSVVKFFN